MAFPLDGLGAADEAADRPSVVCGTKAGVGDPPIIQKWQRSNLMLDRQSQSTRQAHIHASRTGPVPIQGAYAPVKLGTHANLIHLSASVASPKIQHDLGNNPVPEHSNTQAEISSAISKADHSDTQKRNHFLDRDPAFPVYDNPIFAHLLPGKRQSIPIFAQSNPTYRQ